jgi:hypothetical protein
VYSADGTPKLTQLKRCLPPTQNRKSCSIATCSGEWYVSVIYYVQKISEVSHRQLSKEEEAATEEVQVRREDQEKINKFSKLHQRHAMLEEELKQKQASVERIPCLRSDS